LRTADHGDQHLAIEQAFGHPLHIGERDRVVRALRLL
jgi:hypothetical protein